VVVPGGGVVLPGEGVEFVVDALEPHALVASAANETNSMR
jgi:hypothetical protein